MFCSTRCCTSSIPLAARAARWFPIQRNFAKKKSASPNSNEPAASWTASPADVISVARLSNASLSFVVRSQGYHYFSPGVFFCQIPNGRGDLTQPVTLVNDRCYLSGLHEIVHHSQVGFVRSRQKRDELLAPE